MGCLVLTVLSEATKSDDEGITDADVAQDTPGEGAPQDGPQAIDGIVELCARTEIAYDTPGASPLNTTGKDRVVNKAKGEMLETSANWT